MQNCLLPFVVLTSLVRLHVEGTVFGPIRTSRQNHNCPWRDLRTNLVLTIFASPVVWLTSVQIVSTLSSDGVWRVSKIAPFSKRLPATSWIAKMVIVRGDVPMSAPQNSVVHIKDSALAIGFEFHEPLRIHLRVKMDLHITRDFWVGLHSVWISFVLTNLTDRRKRGLANFYLSFCCLQLSTKSNFKISLPFSLPNVSKSDVFKSDTPMPAHM